ncbi:hypothetical protein [Intrasporangium sp. YIM S08009]|uniref:hypothetical protein n=1 Tax=Intrasporangium zincisolvens TaxID=3080018 RepID=UPI002B057D27|nr:hypothetical protein [Intrasporangium sp. YIM S08009]
MDRSQSELRRESEFFSRQIAPIAQQILEATDAWAAYRAGNKISDALVDDLSWLPHGGDVYRGWAELTDLYETGKTPIIDAHAALRKAAVDWLDMSYARDATIDEWIGNTATTVNELAGRDGDFWRSPS